MFCDNCQDFWRIAVLESSGNMKLLSADDKESNLSIKENQQLQMKRRTKNGTKTRCA